MKSATEKRLLFALLVSSLVPLALLGLGATAAVHRLGQEVAREGREASLARMRNELLARAFEAANRSSSYLALSKADLRTLAETPTTRSAYVRFEASSRDRTVDLGGEQSSRGVSKYTAVAFLGPDGRSRVSVERGSAQGASIGWQEYVGGARSLGPGHIQVSRARLPDRSRAGARCLVLATPVYRSSGGLEGVAAAALNPDHLRALLASIAQGDSGQEPGTRALLFDGAGWVVSEVPGASQENGSLAAEQLLGRYPSVLADVRAGRSGVLEVYGNGGVGLLAYAPVYFEYEPSQPAAVFGGVALLQPSVGWTSHDTAVSAMAQVLVRRAEIQNVALTLLCAAWVGFAGFIVARRMARPWVRLHEKVRLANPALASEGLPRHDEVEAISSSFDALASHVEEHAGRLRATEERLREFIEMCPDGIAVLGFDGRIDLANRSLCQMLRRSPGELEQSEARATFARPAEFDEMTRRLAEKGRLKDYEVLLRRGDGSTFPALFTLRLAQEDGSRRIEAILRDVSALKEAQQRDRDKTEELFRVHGELSRAHEALRRAYEEVEEQVRRKTNELRSACEALQSSDRVKTEFLMKMSHELRTPLNCIIGYSEAIAEGLDGPVTEEQGLSLTRITQSGKRLLRMIEDLLDLSRLESGGMEFLCCEMRVEDVVEEVLHQVRSLVGERPIRLEVALAEPLPSVWADPDRVRQVLFNLLGNALKFTDGGSVRVEAVRGPGQTLEVRVCDTGPGVPADQRDSIFERFVQIPGRNRTGAGLGLPICRELVERMGGRIWVESEAGRGSTFGFNLPSAGAPSQLSLPLGPVL
jgi:PAS domain S-box-containing protein